MLCSNIQYLCVCRRNVAFSRLNTYYGYLRNRQQHISKMIKVKAGFSTDLRSSVENSHSSSNNHPRNGIKVQLADEVLLG